MTVSVLAGLLLSAVLLDLRSRRVPNWLVLTGIGLALAGHTIAMLSSHVPLAGLAWWSPLAGLATGLVLMLPLHLLRAMGAGDVKLMAMVGAFVGPATVATATLYTLLAGGLLSLVFLFGRGVAAQAFANMRVMLSGGHRAPPLQTTAARLPYAVAIALGTGAALLWPLGGP